MDYNDRYLLNQGALGKNLKVNKAKGLMNFKVHMTNLPPTNIKTAAKSGRKYFSGIFALK